MHLNCKALLSGLLAACAVGLAAPGNATVINYNPASTSFVGYTSCGGASTAFCATEAHFDAQSLFSQASGGIAPLFDAAFNAWNPGGWTISGISDPGGSFNITTSTAGQFSDGGYLLGGLTIDAYLDNLTLPSLGADQQLVWVQGLFLNFVPRTAGTPVTPYFAMDTSTLSGLTCGGTIFCPPAYPYQYTDRSFYDQPKDYYFLPPGSPQAFFEANAYLAVEDASNKTLQLLDGFSYGFQNFVVPEPNSLFLALAALLLVTLGRRGAAARSRQASGSPRARPRQGQAWRIATSRPMGDQYDSRKAFRRSNAKKVVAAALFLLHAAAATAGFVTEPAAAYVGLDRNNNPRSIFISWLPNIINLTSDLATINNADQLQQLFAKAPAPLPIVDAFFVDAINFCAEEEYQPNVGKLVGCAQLPANGQPGHAIVLDSQFVANSLAQNTILGALDLGHEVAHNAGLIHVQGNNTNLMNPILGAAVITEAQFLQILDSGLPQFDPATGRDVIFVQPIAVVRIPEPPTPFLAFLSLLAMSGCAARRPLRRVAGGGGVPEPQPCGGSGPSTPRG